MARHDDRASQPGRKRPRGRTASSWTVGGENPMQLHCRLLVNSAGLGAPALGAALQRFPQDHVPPGYLCKGNYFTLSPREVAVPRG
jgi:L-2-hydroxyglutarate oxidase LhgO